MCGLCGIVEFGCPPEIETVARMSATLAHRGPDGTGAFSDRSVALGFCRLAIIDLSKAGNQPFASSDGRYQLLHNGEIYNYRELRVELEAAGHRFRTGTDTEVLLAAYCQWGERCVERLNGMWAFVVWDRVEQRLFCSRDRFGVKPFYYSWDGSRFVFASELKAFTQSRLPLRANHRVVRDYLEQGYLDHTVETFFDGIVRLPPSHSLSLSSTGLKLTRHWHLQARDSPDSDPAELVRELFLDSVRLRLRSDVPIGTALSGGLDSSSIACSISYLLNSEPEAAALVGTRQRTFTAYFKDRGFDERPYAQAVVDWTAADPHWISYDSEELIEHLPEIVWTQDEPFGSASIVSQWFVMRAARDAGIKVMLNGQGGDEVFAGYPVYFGSRFADLLRGVRFAELGTETGAYRRLHGATTVGIATAISRPFLSEQLKWRLRARQTGSHALVHPDLQCIPITRQLDDTPFPDYLRRQLAVILGERGLPELLHYEDRNSMAHSIESRVPFLDYRLVELLFSLDGGQLISHGRTKDVLRRALGDLLPPVVRDRIDKLGFVTPAGRFFRGGLGTFADEVFSDPSFANRGFVDAVAVRRRLALHRQGKLEAGFEVWRALNLELWARAFLDPA